MFVFIKNLQIHAVLYTPEGYTKKGPQLFAALQPGCATVRRRDLWTVRSAEEGGSVCSNATQLVACSFNKSSTSASRLFAAARRRTPGNERLHLIRRKWKRNHAQKTPTGGSRRVRYSASVDWVVWQESHCYSGRSQWERRSLVACIAVLSCHCTWSVFTLSVTYFSLSLSLSVSLCVSVMRLDSKYVSTL